MASWAPLGLISVTAALLALPVTPAFYELRKRGDVTPLPTSRHDGNIQNFAEVFRSQIEPLLPQLEQCLSTRELSRIKLERMEILLVGRDDFDFDPKQMRGISTLMLPDMIIPAGKIISADIFTNGKLNVGKGTAIRAALAEADIVLASNSTALRWLHSDGTVYMSTGSASYGRLSALESIRLEPGCSFQHMHAPSILTVATGDEALDLPACDIREYAPAKSYAGELSDSEPTIYAVGAFASRPRLRVHGDFVLPEGETMNANVIATGDLRLARGSRFLGSAKSYKDTIVEEDAIVQGSLVSGRTIHLGARSFVAGPVMAERDILMSRGACVGAPDALTTISSCNVQLATGCRMCGTVWARVHGTIED